MKINGFENINKDITFGQILSGTTFIVASDTMKCNQYIPIYMKCFRLHCEDDNSAVDRGNIKGVIINLDKEEQKKIGSILERVKRWWVFSFLTPEFTGS